MGKRSASRSRAWRAVLAALALLAAGPAQGADGGGFVAGVDDLPLMPGLTEKADAGMVFDAPGGRFVEVEVTGAASADEVTTFYAATLPELGWRRIGDGEYAREGETLRLDVTEAGGRVTVRFVVAPADGP